MGHCVAIAAFVVGLSLCESAGAQLGFTVTGRYDAVTKGSGRYGSVAVYPFAPFQRGGILEEAGVGTETSHGMLFAADFGYTPSSGRSYELGGWFWQSGDSNVRQIHGKVFLTKEIGVQLGWIGNSRNDLNAYTLFLIYDLASANVAPESRRKWAVQGGLGVFDTETRDPITPGAKGPKHTDFTMYVQASMEIGKNFSVNATHWYLRDALADLNRFALGVGYSF